MQGFFQTHVEGVFCAVESEGPHVAAVLGVYPVAQLIATPPQTERLDVASTPMAQGFETGQVTAIPVAVAVCAIQTALIQHDPSAHAARFGPQATGGVAQAVPAEFDVQIPFVQQLPSAQAVVDEEQVFTGGGIMVPSQFEAPVGIAEHAPFIQHGLSTVQACAHADIARGAATVEGAAFVGATVEGAASVGATVEGATFLGATVEGATANAGAGEAVTQESAVDTAHCPLTQHNNPVELEGHGVLSVHC
jgi:hypothetical protein